MAIVPDPVKKIAAVCWTCRLIFSRDPVDFKGTGALTAQERHSQVDASGM